jgi:hypothetical protein
MSEKFYATKLRFNPNEEDHQELSLQLDEIYCIAEAHNRSTKHYGDTEIACDAAVTLAQAILKREWERVKVGEPTFAAAKSVFTRALVALAAVGVLSLTIFVVQSSKG